MGVLNIQVSVSSSISVQLECRMGQRHVDQQCSIQLKLALSCLSHGRPIAQSADLRSSRQCNPPEASKCVQLVDRTGRHTLSVAVLARPEALPDATSIRFPMSFEDLLPINEQQELRLRFRLQKQKLRTSQNSTGIGPEADSHRVGTPLLYVGGIHGSYFYGDHRGGPVSLPVLENDAQTLTVLQWVTRYHVLQIWHTKDEMQSWIRFETLRDCDNARADLDAHHPSTNMTDQCLGFSGHKLVHCIGPKQFERGTGHHPNPQSQTFASGFLGMVLIQVVPSNVNEHVPRVLSGGEARILEEVAMARLNDVFPSNVVRAFGVAPPSNGDDMPTMTFVAEFEFPDMANFWRYIDISSSGNLIQVSIMVRLKD